MRKANFRRWHFSDLRRCPPFDHDGVNSGRGADRPSSAWVSNEGGTVRSLRPQVYRPADHLVFCSKISPSVGKP